MFYRRALEYIIAYKMMIHKQTITGLYIDLLTQNSVDIIYNMVKDFNTHGCMIEFDTLLLSLLLKENI